jgi:hypothetical protein
LEIFLVRSICVLLLFFGGCSEPSKWDRIPLQGTATLDGQPIDGAISFRPARGVQGPSVNTELADGQFRFTKSNGPVVGRHDASLLLPRDPANPNDTPIRVTVDVPVNPPFDAQLAFVKPTASAKPQSVPAAETDVPMSK